MLGGPNQRQHVVEFKDGTGVIQDGIVVNSASGPWTWVVPTGVRLLLVSGVGGGSGGTGGTNNATSTGGGGGGGPGLAMVNAPVFVTPGASLTITLGAGGTGGTPTTGATNGGDTTVSGLYFQPYGEGTVFKLFGGGANQTTRTDGAGQDSGSVGGNAPGSNASPGLAGGTSAATPTNATGAARLSLYGYYLAVRGTGGGGASTNPATSGANGGSNTQTNNYAMISANSAVSAIDWGSGNTTGTVSRGGGGIGGFSRFGYGGSGGNGGVDGGDATGYGAGGGGGGGGANGGDGSVGYLYITYWEVD